MDTFRVDLRARKTETREVVVGDAMHFEVRTNIINLDGSVEEGEWLGTGTILNYGDYLDKRPTFWRRILSI